MLHLCLSENEFCSVDIYYSGCSGTDPVDKTVIKLVSCQNWERQNRECYNQDKWTLIAQNICTMTGKKIEGSQNTLKSTTFFADTRHQAAGMHPYM